MDEHRFFPFQETAMVGVFHPTTIAINNEHFGYAQCRQLTMNN